jgi:catechol 2,3-dioxygenase-like lactoylglutathione lyase family enzyme
MGNKSFMFREVTAMNDGVDSLLTRYERGQITRRQFLAATSVLIAAPAALSAPDPIGSVQQLNHVTLFARDVQTSVRFYQELLGMPVLTEQSPGINLNAGTGFIGIYPAQQSASPSINHFCLGMKDFEPDAVLKQLKDRGVQANIRLRGDTKELYFNDPDNLRVQLQDVKYKGGVGLLGDRDPK